MLHEQDDQPGDVASSTSLDDSSAYQENGIDDTSFNSNEEEYSPAIASSKPTQINEYFVRQVTAAVLADIGPKIEEKTSTSINILKQESSELVKESRKEIEQTRNSILSVIAIFVSLFTFISVNVNIFSKSTFQESILIMVCMWILLAGFSISFFFILNINKDKYLKYLSITLATSFLLPLIASIFYLELAPDFKYKEIELYLSTDSNFRKIDPINYELTMRTDKNLGIKLNSQLSNIP